MSAGFEHDPILFSGRQVTANPDEVAAAMVSTLESQRAQDEEYEQRHGRRRALSNWDLYKMSVFGLFNDEWESYFCDDGATYRPRDSEGYPIQPTPEERAVERAEKSPTQIAEQESGRAERRRRYAVAIERRDRAIQER